MLVLLKESSCSQWSHVEPDKNCRRYCIALCYYASHARYSDHKESIAEYLVSISCVQLTTAFPEQGFEC